MCVHETHPHLESHRSHLSLATTPVGYPRHMKPQSPVMALTPLACQLSPVVSLEMAKSI